jgi:hypothetical protein
VERRRLLVAQAARASLAFDGKLTGASRADTFAQIGLTPGAYRTLFSSDDDLLDLVNDLLVEECASRLQASVADFSPIPGSSDPLVDAAAALARSRPVERTGLLVRTERRLNALRQATAGARVVAAEKRFIAALTDVLIELLRTVGRRFTWRPELAVRVILDTYERSFEAWLLHGGDESAFHESTYITVTLPTILRETSTPL